MPVASLEIEMVHVPALNFAMEHAGVPLVRDIVVKNAGTELLHDAHLSLQLTPELGEAQWIDVPDLHPGDSVNLGPVQVRASPGRLRQVVEAERARLEWRLRSGADELVRGQGDVTILAYNEWPAAFAPELLVSFVTPNHPVVMRVLRRVADRLTEMTGDGALAGYQSHSKTRVKQTLEALYQTIQGLGIGYVEAPASFTGLGQKVRLPDRVLVDQLGSCVDLSVLFSSCLEQMGLRPLLILVKGHAFLAVWLIDDLFPEGIIEDAARLRSQIALGNLLPIDATVAVAAGKPPMEAAVAAALEYLGNDEAFERALDVKALRTKYLPLPIRDVASEPESDIAELPSRVEVRRILEEALREEEAPPPLPEPPAPETARFRKWEEKLLDLTLRNRLLSFSLEARTILPLDGFDLAIFEDRFAADETFQIIARPDSNAIDSARVIQRDTTSAQHVAEEFKRGRLGSSLTADALWSRAIRLDRDARTAIEESGASNLFVSIGVLRWFETKEAEKPRLAPLLLYPARLEFDRRKRRVQVKRTEQDPIANVTLVEKLGRDFNIDLAPMAALDVDQSGIDVPLLLRRAREAIQRMPRWEVLDIACVGLFSFTKFLMWKDLRDNGEILLRNPVVRHLAMGEGVFVNEAEAILAERIDADVPPDRLPCVVDADSTQMAAVANAMRGRSFVLQGPPGTGKSQTITNLIAAALADGKTVLFVSEKMAALEVVQRRLSEVGLADFCLELHSNKANKKAVLDSLAATLNRRERTAAPPWSERCHELADSRTELNAYVDALHRPWPLGLTFHEVTAQLLSLTHAPDVRLTFDRIAEWTAERFRAASLAIVEHAARSVVVEPVAANAWRACQLKAWSSDVQEQVADALSKTRDALDRVDAAAGALGICVGTKVSSSTVALDSFATFCGAIADGPLPAEVASIPDAVGFGTRIRAYVKMKEEQDSDRAKLDQRWSNALLEVDLVSLRTKYEKWKHSFSMIAFVALVGARSKLKRVALGSLPTRDEIASDLVLASRVREQQGPLDAEREWLTKTLGSSVPDDGSLSPFAERCARAVEAAVALKRQGCTDADLATATRAPAAVVRRPQIELRDALSEANAAERSLQQLLGVASSAWPDRASGWHRADLRRLIDRWASALGSLRAWCLYQQSADSLVALGLANLHAAHADGRVRAETLVASFRRAFFSRWVAAVRETEPSLRVFDGAAHHRLVERFRNFDREHVTLSRQLVVNRLEKRLPTSQTQPAESSELGILLRETHKKARHLSIRRLLHDIQRLLPRLKPCLMMSPLSIAQYLPADGTRFDLVVFDEASQIGTHDAIGAIARGNQVVIVGDSKQLPPTTFFQRQGEDDEDDPDENDIHDLESVLEEAEAKQMPQQRLGWHYRSRHESLIEFSNRHYYSGNLHVFPAAAAESDSLGVSWSHVPDGIYEAGGRGERARTNLREAQSLVDQLVSLLQQYKPEERTFGVVTFSLPQQTLVQDLLEEQRARLPELEAHFTGPERVFIKNLENVQGDERDEILFSICYAKDAAGKLRMHFGPLSTNGGERRLNVAVTRARQRLRVFSTLTPDQIDLRRTSSVGAVHLKAFLEYAARRGRGTSTTAEARVFATEFERQLASAVDAQGHRVKTQVGCSGYRIDIAVEKPAAPGTFSVAVEGDGPAYATGKSARDRDRLRQDVLAGLGWTVHRVWSSDWILERIREEQRLTAALGINHPSSSPPPLPVRDKPQNIVVPPPLVYAAAAPATNMAREANHELYRAVQISAADPGEDFYSPSADDGLHARILAIVDGEGPVHFDFMAYRLIECWGLTKLTARSRDRVEKAMKSLQRRKQLVRRGAFLWPTTLSLDSYLRYRLPDDAGGTRPIEYIPPEEIANAAAFLLREALSIEREELARTTARLFGVLRSSRNIADCIDEGISRLETSSRCRVDGSRVFAA